MNPFPNHMRHLPFLFTLRASAVALAQASASPFGVQYLLHLDRGDAEYIDPGQQLAHRTVYRDWPALQEALQGIVNYTMLHQSRLAYSA